MEIQATTFSMIVAGLIEARLRANGQNQTDLFNRANISQATWARLCKGHAKLDLEQLHVVEDTMGYDMVELIAEAKRIEKLAEAENIRIIPPLPTLNGKLTMQDGLKILAIGAIAYLAIKAATK